MIIDSSHNEKRTMKEMDAVLKFLKENGFKTHRKRVEYYQEILNRFYESSALTDDEAWALTEMHEIYIVIEGAKINAHIKKSLPRCIKGAHTLEEELAANSGNAPRNATFELFMVSKMVLLGANIKTPPFGQSADINFFSSGCSVPIECKRLYAIGNVSRIVQETCSQVSRRVNDGEYGIAAISLTRELWSSVSSVMMESREEARKSVEKIYHQWKIELVKQLESYPKVALIYIHFHIPMIGENNNFYIYEREFYRTRVKYELLKEAPIVDDFIKIMRHTGIMNAIKNQNFRNDCV